MVCDKFIRFWRSRTKYTGSSTISNSDPGSEEKDILQRDRGSEPGKSTGGGYNRAGNYSRIFAFIKLRLSVCKIFLTMHKIPELEGHNYPGTYQISRIKPKKRAENFRDYPCRSSISRI